MLQRPARLIAASAALGVCLAGIPALAEDGPIVGTPPLPDAAQGWVQGWSNPDYWSSYAHDAVVNGHVNVPYPNDPVKPEAFLVNVPVADGRYVSALPVKHRDLSRITYEYGGQTKTIAQFVRTTRTDQVVIVKDGVVVGELYANGFSADIRHQAWPVTKTLVGALVGIAHAEGRIRSVREPIERYLPQLRGTEWQGVSIEDILQMESGVHWDEDTPVLAVNTQVEQWRDLALDLYSGGAVGKTRNEFLATLPSMGYRAGTEFHYNSGNTQVLAWMLERPTSGRRWRSRRPGSMRSSRLVRCRLWPLTAAPGGLMGRWAWTSCDSGGCASACSGASRSRWTMWRSPPRSWAAARRACCSRRSRWRAGTASLLTRSVPSCGPTGSRQTPRTTSRR
jgi:hypothetical protein